MFRLASELCFGSSIAEYDLLLKAWLLITQAFPGWTLTEIKELTPRERINWLEMARENGKVVTKNA